MKKIKTQLSNRIVSYCPSKDGELGPGHVSTAHAERTPRSEPARELEKPKRPSLHLGFSCVRRERKRKGKNPARERWEKGPAGLGACTGHRPFPAEYGQLRSPLSIDIIHSRPLSCFSFLFVTDCLPHKLNDWLDIASIALHVLNDLEPLRPPGLETALGRRCSESSSCSPLTSDTDSASCSRRRPAEAPCF
jgi:hypothetical protein